MDYKVIHTQKEHLRALAAIDALLTAEGGPPRDGSPEEAELEILTVLVHDYESKHIKIDPPDPVEAILFRMDQQGLTRRDLEPLLGGPSRVSEVLNRRRPLSIAMIRNLVAIGIPARSLVGAPGKASRSGRSKRVSGPRAARSTKNKRPGRRSGR